MSENLNKLRRKGFAVFITVILLLSVPTLLVNNFFFFSDFNESYTVELIGDEVTEDNLNVFRGQSGLTRIDREENVAYFQNIDNAKLDEIQKTVQEETGLETLTSTIYPSRTLENTLLSAISIVGIFVVVGFFSTFYFVFRNSVIKGGYVSVLKAIGILIAFVTTSILLQITAISVVSRYYQIREIDLLSVVIVGIWSASLFFLAWINLRNTAKHSLNRVIRELSSINGVVRTYVITSLTFMLVPLMFGLGSSFVITGILLGLSILIPVPQITIMNRIRHKYFLNNKKSKEEFKTNKGSKSIDSVSSKNHKRTASWKRNKKKNKF